LVIIPINLGVYKKENWFLIINQANVSALLRETKIKCAKLNCSVRKIDQSFEMVLYSTEEVI